jgi:RNA-directed DNA polymerase
MLPSTVEKAIGSLPAVVRSGRRVNGLFRLMKSPSLWDQAYQKVAPNKGALTPGVDGQTFDGYSPEKVRTIIAKLTEGTYKPAAVRRVFIPKADGRMRPLGIPTTEDKLVQEVVRILLNEIYEPIFCEDSHGFRQGRSCHTALKSIYAVWTGVKWLVDVDVVGFFDNIDHAILIRLLEKRIADKRFIALIRGMLKAGYMEDWRFHRTLSGTPQGGIVSPLLANIYLHELDEWMQARMTAFNGGKKRAALPDYRRSRDRLARLRRRVERLRASEHPDPVAIASLLDEISRQSAECRALPATDSFDPNYRRLRYCRYADDFIIGVAGSKAEARQIMDEVRRFLAEHLKLTVSEKKSGITHASDGARFLGYDICTRTHPNSHRANFGRRRVTRRGLKDRVQLHVPREKVLRFVRDKKWGNFDACKPAHRTALLYASDVEIAAAYNAELRGFANYYALACDVKRKLNKAEYLAFGSFLRTLANKHKSTTTRIARRLRKGQDFYVGYEVQGKPRVLKLWKLKNLEKKVLRYGTIDAIPHTPFVYRDTELVERLNARACERCGRQDRPCEVHHLRRLSDMQREGDILGYMRAARLRKRIVLCIDCHEAAHSYRPYTRPPRKLAEVESRMR